MTTKTRLLTLVVAICLVAVLALGMIGCTDKEDVVTIKSYSADLTYTVGAEFAPVVTVTKSDDTTASLTIATNPAVEIPATYKTTLKLVEENDKLVYSEAGEYTLDVLYCGEKLTLNITIEDEE